MSGRNKFTEQTDYVSSRIPKRRKVDLEFDAVRLREGQLVFYRDGKFICAIGREHFTMLQADFFEAIAEP
jgi:hypothetical protein